MSKGHVGEFLRYMQALFKDIEVAYPELRLDLDRDFSRIKSSTAHMGSRVFLEFLPEVGKVLDLSLSQGRLDRHSIPFMRAYKNGVHIPRLFKGIWSRLFADDGCLKHDIDPTLVQLFRTVLMSCKKYQMECPPSALYETTEDFYVTDRQLPPPSLDWLDEGFSGSWASSLTISSPASGGSDHEDLFRPSAGDDARMLDTIQRSFDIVAGTLGLYDYGCFRHGPGAVSDRLRGVEKFLPTRWSRRLERAFPVVGTALPLHHQAPSDDSEIASRLIAVPKTIKGPRLIAAEPSDHIWCQFSVMEFLTERTHSTWLGRAIDFKSQEHSRRQALEGSRSRKNATIDLKSASDRISLWLVERAFRKNPALLEVFQSSRTAYVDLSIDKKLPSLIRLRKFTTQGSALTFPVQSLIFLAITLGALAYARGLEGKERQLMRLAREVQIFGDDIILPKDGVEALVRSLDILYLKVNTAKSHFLGSFRESCGMDAWDGYDVTPPYVSRLECTTAADIPSIAATSNNFFRKGLWNTAKMIESTLPRWAKLPVVHIRERQGDSGIIDLISYSGSAVPKSIRFRENSALQRKEGRFVVQKTNKRPLKVDDSRLLVAYLANGESRIEEPFMGILEAWRPLSRWESRPVVGLGWVAPTTL